MSYYSRFLGLPVSYIGPWWVVLALDWTAIGRTQNEAISNAEYLIANEWRKRK